MKEDDLLSEKEVNAIIKMTKIEIEQTPKQKLIDAISKLIQKKDPSSEEREIWALEEAIDLAEGILP